MAIKKYMIVFVVFSLICCSKQSSDSYKIESVFNSTNRTSTIYLIQNKLKIDSIAVDNWYGKDSIHQIDSWNWKYFYSQRCGSGCAIRNQLLLTIYKDKIKKLYDGLAFYTYHSTIKDSLTHSFKSILLEYDSVNIVEDNGVWYMNCKKLIDDIYTSERNKIVTKYQ